MFKKFKSHYIHLLISLACLVVLLYFGILIYKEVKPKTYQEQYMRCLELGSNARAAACVKLINNQK